MEQIIVFRHVDTPFGPLLIAANADGIVAIRFPRESVAAEPESSWVADDGNNQHLDAAVRQLGEYFARSRSRFELTLTPAGTPFQLEVWRALERIPHGETRTYAQIAAEIGRPKAVRAVGAANGRNPLPIVVPCHRVVGSDGSLTGFGGGIPVKKFLLELEQPA